MTTTQSERDVRIAKIHALREMGINPFAQKFDKQQNIGALINDFAPQQLADGQTDPQDFRDVNDVIENARTDISTAGRLTLFRSHGKLSFGRLMDEHGEIQIMFHRDAVKYGASSIKIERNPQSRTSTAPLQKEPDLAHVFFDFQANAQYIKDNNLITDGYCLPYHPDAKQKAHELRKNMTKAEKKLWYDLLTSQPEQRYRQKPIDHFIADFFCPSLGLIIEVDGDSHAKQGEYDEWRSDILELYGLQVIRFSNEEVLQNIQSIEKKLTERKASFGKEVPDRAEDLSTKDGDSSRTLPDDISPYKLLQKYIDVGDFLGIRGEVFRTHKGELTIFVSEFQLLSKAIRPLGDKFHGIGENNQETAYRQRYLDMIHNRESLERMKLRSKFIKTIREFYRSHDFMELETPILGHSASGAAAQPFVTHHNDFDIDMYLRIAPETALKMATVGGLERVFEIGKDFRNEGSSPSHHQEFTAAEHYAAYWSFEDNMRFTEQMFDYIFDHMPELSRKVMIADKEGVEREVDFSTPRKRVDYIAQIHEDSGIDVSQYGPSDEEKLRATIKENGFDRVGLDTQATATMIDYLYKKVTRPKIIGPAFIYNYPKTMQPLARQSDADPEIVEQFQCIVNGREILKAYSELVDPLTQQANFDEQADALARGDEEATSGDDDFVTSMEYGMPNQSGRGMGIDRIFAMLTQQKNIRDVILFPLMKPENDKGNSSNKTYSAIAILNQDVSLEPRQRMNTIAHLSASYAARQGKGLFNHDTIQTADGQNITLNVDHAIMIKEGKSPAIKQLIAEAKQRDIAVSEFTREMLETTDDAKIVTQTKEKSFDDIEHLGVLLYGPKKLVDEMTKNYALYNGDTVSMEGQRHEIVSDSITPATTSVSPSFSPETVTQAEELAEKYLTDTLGHCQQVGRIMRGFASELGQDENYWYVVGLLHDVDRDRIEKSAPDHLQGFFVEIVNELDISDEDKGQLIHDIRTHYPDGTGLQPENTVQKYLISADELSGLIHAYSLMRPEGLEGMKRSSLKKKIKDKKFAAGVDREHVRNCEKYLDIPLEEFAMKLVEKMQG